MFCGHTFDNKIAAVIFVLGWRLTFVNSVIAPHTYTLYFPHIGYLSKQKSYVAWNYGSLPLKKVCALGFFQIIILNNNYISTMKLIFML